MSKYPLTILLAEDDLDVREIIVFFLTSNFNARIIEVGSGNEAIEVLKKSPEISLVISDYRMPNGSGGHLFLYLHALKSTLPFILVSSDPPAAYPEFHEFKPHGYAEKPAFQTALFAAVSSAIASLSSLVDPIIEAESEVQGEFCPVRISLLRRLDVLPVDVYVRLSPQKCLKLLKVGDAFEGSDLERFKVKRVEYLYLRQVDTAVLIEKLIREYVSLSTRMSTAAATGESECDVFEDFQDVIWTISRELGFTRELEGLVKTNVRMAVASLVRCPGLENLAAIFQRRSGNYLSSHSVILAYTACGIASQMGWKSDGTYYKLTLAACLHDITLPSADLAKIESAEELYASPDRFSKSDVAAFLEHPAAAAKIAAGFTEVPPDVDVIILQHHERPQGGGFPSGMNHVRISPIAAVFIVAQEYLQYVNKNGSVASLGSFLDEREQAYNWGSFKKIRMALIQGALT